MSQTAKSGNSMLASGNNNGRRGSLPEDPAGNRVDVNKATTPKSIQKYLDRPRNQNTAYVSLKNNALDSKISSQSVFHAKFEAMIVIPS
jgi:hypothetical protein